MNMHSPLCQIALTLLLVAPCIHSLPVERPHIPRLRDIAAPGTLVGGESGDPIAETPGHNTSDSPSAALREEILLKNLNNANPPVMVMLALQLHLEASDSHYHQSLVRERCDETVAKLAPAVNDTYCPWKYTCEYHQHRYPNFVVQAECQNLGSECPSCASKDPGSVKSCLEISKPIYYLKRSSTDGTWQGFRGAIVTSCQCRR